MPEAGWAFAPVVAAYAVFLALSAVLTVIDVRSHRLPDRIVLPGYVSGVALFAIACLLGAEWASLLRGLIGMTALWLFYFTLRALSPDGMGGGDVKLAGVVGLYTAWIGWSSFVVGAVAAFLVGGLAGLVMLVTRHAGRRTRIAFGPWMLAGAWIGILAGEHLGRAHVGA